MRYLLILFMMALIKDGAVAQRRSPVSYEDRWALRFSPISLIDVMDGNLTIGAAYALSSRLTVSTDLSFIFYSAYIENKKSVYGYIFKPGIRYYLSGKRRFFLEAMPFYKRVGYNIRDWLGKDAVDGVPAYQELTNFTFRKQVLGLNIMAGVQKSLMRNNRFRMEIYAGINVRYKWQDIKHYSNATYTPNDIFDDSFYAPTVFGAGIPHGMRLVYILK